MQKGPLVIFFLENANVQKLWPLACFKAMTRTFKIIAIVSYKWISMATLTPSFPTLSSISESLKTICHFFQHRQQSKDFKFILEDVTQTIFISDL